MNALGVEGDEYDVVQPDDERWHTELGKVTWEDYIQVKLSSEICPKCE